MATRQQANKALVTRFITDLVNGQQYALADEVLTTDYTRHDPNTPGTERGPAPWIDTLRALHDAFPDHTVTIDELIAEDDRVAFAGRMTGTHTGPFRGLEATDARFDVRGHAMHRIEGGRIAETWATWDFLGVLAALGVVDPPR